MESEFWVAGDRRHHYATREEAVARAREWSNIHPGQTFYVYKATLDLVEEVNDEDENNTAITLNRLVEKWLHTKEASARGVLAKEFARRLQDPATDLEYAAGLLRGWSLERDDSRTVTVALTRRNPDKKHLARFLSHLYDDDIDTFESGFTNPILASDATPDDVRAYGIAHPSLSWTVQKLGYDRILEWINPEADPEMLVAAVEAASGLAVGCYSDPSDHNKVHGAWTRLERCLRRIEHMPAVECEKGRIKEIFDFFDEVRWHAARK